MRAKRSLICLAVALASILIGCVTPRGGSTRSIELSTQDRIEVFDKVWKTVNEKYYDPSFNGVDWNGVRERYRPRLAAARSDEDFYALLDHMLGELRDAHSLFRSPRQREAREKRQATSAGIAIREIEGTPVIVTVDPGSDAARAGVEPGMIVRTIDGLPFADRLAEARDEVGLSSSERITLLKIYTRILAGPPGTPLKLGLTRADGAPLDVALIRRTTSSASPLTAHLLPSGLAYLRFDSFHSPVSKEIRRALEGFRNAPALIIDLRNNGGGDVQEMLRIAGYFFNARIFFGRGITRSGKLSLLGGLVRIPLEAYAGKPGGRIYRAPVVILVSERTGSAGESFAAGMQESERATVIGRQSCGCVNGVIHRFRQKGGGELQFSELGYASPKGRKLEGEGVTPDQVVALTLADLRSGRDAGVEAAESFLRRDRAGFLGADDP